MGTKNLVRGRYQADSPILPGKNSITSLVSDPKERSRFFRFAAVGIIGAVIDFAVFNLLIQLTNFEAVWASTCSFIAAVISNFIWNRYWTYPDSRSKKVSRQLFQFFVVSVVGMVIRIGMFAALENFLINAIANVLPSPFIVSPTFVGHNATLAFSILIVMIWNFIANRYWTYSDVE